MQVFLVILAISAATIYLGWQAYKRFFKKETSCESCAFGESSKKV